MTFDERLTYALIGGLIGFIVGYMVRVISDIRKTVHNVEDRVIENESARAKRDEDGLVRKPLLLDFVLLAVVIMVTYASIQSQLSSNRIEANEKQDLINRCEAGEESRTVLRSIVEAVYTLATGAATRSAEDPPLTPYELNRYNAYVERTNAFREEMYDMIKPPDYCLPYSDDDNVKPPGGPFPTIPPGG